MPYNERIGGQRSNCLRKQESKNKGDQYWNQVTLSSKATQYTRGKIRDQETRE
jgi:hypothetical protein